MGGCFAVVAHAFRDYGQWDALGFGCRCPAMTGDVKSQWNCYSNHSGNTFKTVVDVVASVAVGASFIESGISDNWK